MDLAKLNLLSSFCETARRPGPDAELLAYSIVSAGRYATLKFLVFAAGLFGI
jgi:hypothetical protein